VYEVTSTDNKSDATLTKLWLILAQLEAINAQFALYLDTITVLKPNTTPSNSLGNQSNQLDVLTENMLNNLLMPSTQHDTKPALPPCTTLNPAPPGPIPLLLMPSGKHTLPVHTPP